jgi:hypothetical protein
MRAKEYPLLPLARLRAQQVEDAARALAGRIAAREDAARRRAGAEHAAAAHDEAVRAARASLRASLDRGELTVADLMRADAWESRVREERGELEQRLRGASERERTAAAAEAHAREAASLRAAEGEVVERHRERFAAGERAAADAAEEEDAHAAFLGQKRAR